MTIKTLVGATALAFGITAGASSAATLQADGMSQLTGVSASTLDFNFSFDQGANRLTGTVFGLTDDSTGTASLVSVTQSPGGAFDIIPEIFQNEFVVRDGVLTNALFSSGSASSDAFFNVHFQISGGSGIFSADEAITGQGLSAAGAISFSPVAAVPIPASGLLLLSVFGSVIALRRRKNARHSYMC
ncbi:MAG: hypothetical protein ABJF05_07770 [Paracoccaceae bacterium]